MVLEHHALVRIEGGVKRIERHNGGEQRRLGRAARDQVALIREAAADATVDGSLHLCELDIELRRLGRRLGLNHIGRSDIVFVAARVKLLRSYGASLHQPFGALEILQREISLGFRPLQLGPRPFRLGLIRPGIDYKQQIACLHLLPIFEMDGIQITVDSRAHLDRFDRLQAAGKIIPFGHLLRHRLSRGDFGGRGGDWLRLAGGKQRENEYRKTAADPSPKGFVFHRFSTACHCER